APLRVGALLKEKIFSRERCVVLTGATLSDPADASARSPGNGPSREAPAADGDDREASGPDVSQFSRLRSAVGLEGGRELVLGSPFDYRSAALIVVPEDIPEPGAPGYAKAVAAAITEIALALKDRVLVLFTSNSALENARKAVSGPLQAAGIRVLAQGTDGSPHRVMRALAETRAAVAMGAQSLWEGVDLGGQARRPDDANRTAAGGASIKALLMARLPFPVPTEPIVAARSELYEDGFNEYMVPEAVMRFRQGFGRLIRSRSDRGAFVVLDRRILTKQYGLAFQRSLPRCTVRRVSMAELGDTVRRWNAGEEL
ncbi:MAG: helicase C-terminal domain-containing protein, partial [Dehalococcoidia bacterium]|nr:helicase C-terminal domain-containing protein [Dehalococcoidia bacterium]